MPLLDPEEHPFLEVDHVGIAVCKTGEPDQRHVGFIYATDDASRTYCDLAWHLMLRFLDDPTPRPHWALSKLYWHELAMEEKNRKIVAAFLISLRTEDNHIPYGIDVVGPCFSSDGTYIPQPDGRGMTCATFVMQVYKSLEFGLIDESIWPVRDDDKAWQAAIIQHLKAASNPPSERHIELMESDIGCLRFRPEEVAAATQHPDRPVTFEQCLEMAEQIKNLCA